MISSTRLSARIETIACDQRFARAAEVPAATRRRANQLETRHRVAKKPDDHDDREGD
jgi:hypothetical protein